MPAHPTLLQGPCNGIDTACSSSLVAAHNAHRGAAPACESAAPRALPSLHCPAASPRCRSFQVTHSPALPHPPPGILGGEAAAALAGGINIMVWAETTVGICQLQVGGWGGRAGAGGLRPGT